MSSPPAIEVSELHFAYPDGVPALNGVNLTIAAGERVGLIGANGAGKSTLLLHFNGILRPSRGQVRICGEPVGNESVRGVRQKVGLLFQNPDDQLFCPSVREDVAFGPRNLGLPEPEVQLRVTQALHAVGLDGFAERSAYHLSFGQKRRAALATVLSMNPEILVFDEPSANLDPRGRRELLALLATMPQTMVVATHNLGFVRELCPRCLVLEAGRVVLDAPTSEILPDEALLRSHGM